MAAPESWKYDVALSYAGEQRSYVERVAACLAEQGVSYYYDRDDPTLLWGRNLAEELPRIYEHDAASVVIFVSADYAAKDWTRLERRAALSRAVRERNAYVLPARFDDSVLPGTGRRRRLRRRLEDGTGGVRGRRRPVAEGAGHRAATMFSDAQAPLLRVPDRPPIVVRRGRDGESACPGSLEVRRASWRANHCGLVCRTCGRPRWLRRSVRRRPGCRRYRASTASSALAEFVSMADPIVRPSA